MDVDAQAGLKKVEHPVENIYFDEAPEGDYRVYVRNFSGATVNQAFVRVKVGEETALFSLGPLEQGRYYDVTSFSYSKEPPNIREPQNSDNVELLSYTKAESSETEAGSVANDESDNAGNKIRLNIGETGDEYNFLEVPIFDMHTDKVGLADVDISTQSGALDAIDKIKSAISKVSDVRGTHGALQNRLEHTINYLGAAQENAQSSESVIRDTDMADEMMKYTKNSILTQSAQAMMAQANMLPEGVLRLMQLQ